MVMSWTKLNFSKKHKGKTLPQVMFKDPDWFFWACKKKVFKNKGALQIEADDILDKCQSIKIPHNKSNKFVIEYTFSHQELHHDSFREDVIDFSVPYGSKKYDKLGFRIFLHKAKYILFGNSKYKMTKKRCEEFFSNKDNFKY
jgi:hypothetical protein